MSSSPSPRKRKPGPKPMRPTKRQWGVSIGLTVDQIATAARSPAFGAADQFRLILRAWERMIPATEA
jgi:hypothetical protein